MRYLCFSGGGERGQLHVGAMRALEHTGAVQRTHLRGVSGVSAGSFMALALALGVETPRIAEEAMLLDPFLDDPVMRMLRSKAPSASVALQAMNRFMRTGGVLDAESIREQLVASLERLREGASGITLGDLQRRGHVQHVRILAYSLLRSKIVTVPPHFLLPDALLASMALPFLIPAVHDDLLDAGLRQCVDPDVFHDLDPGRSRTLAVVLRTTKIEPVKFGGKPMAYAMGVLREIMATGTRNALDDTPTRVLKIFTDWPELKQGSREQREAMQHEGFMLALAQLEVA